MADWKDCLKDQCECFTGPLTKEQCKNTNCDLQGLKNLFILDEYPKPGVLVQEFLKCGHLSKREIMFAIVELYKSNYVATERLLERTMNKLKKQGYKVFRGDDNKIRAWKE